MKGRYEEAKKILLQASKTNNTQLSEHSSKKLDEQTVLRDSDEVSSNTVQNEKRKSSIQLLLLIANTSYLWFATVFVYFGLNINSVYLEYWNKYISFIVSHWRDFKTH